MSNLIRFPKLKIGEKVTLTIEGHTFKCKVLAHVRQDQYEVIALEGPYKGKKAVLDIPMWESE